MIITPQTLARQMLCFPCSIQRLANGNTLIADAGDEESQGSKILEVDALGRVVWQYDTELAFAHAAERQPDGNTLIADTNNNRIIEVGSNNQLIFSSESWNHGSGVLSDGSHLDYPNDVHLVLGDAFLITDRNNSRVLLTDRDGNILKKYNDELLRPHNADMLPNGNLLVANSERQEILEISPHGQIVWRYGAQTGQNLSWPRDADRLPDGTTLITDSKNSRIILVDKSGHLLWEYQAPYFANFYEADALKNGHILISDQQHKQVLEVDRFGNVIWCFRNHTVSRPINSELVNGEMLMLTPDSPPPGWTLYTRLAEGGGRIVSDSSIAPHECTGIAYDRQGIVYLAQLVGAEPGTQCIITADLFTRDIINGRAYLQLAFVDALGGYMGDVISQPKSRMLCSTEAWTQCIVQATVPERTTAVEIRILISGPGCVFARNVRLTK